MRLYEPAFSVDDFPGLLLEDLDFEMVALGFAASSAQAAVSACQLRDEIDDLIDVYASDLVDACGRYGAARESYDACVQALACDPSGAEAAFVLLEALRAAAVSAQDTYLVLLMHLQASEHAFDEFGDLL